MGYGRVFWSGRTSAQAQAVAPRLKAARGEHTATEREDEGESKPPPSLVLVLRLLPQPLSAQARTAAPLGSALPASALRVGEKLITSYLIHSQVIRPLPYPGCSQGEAPGPVGPSFAYMRD